MKIAVPCRPDRVQPCRAVRAWHAAAPAAGIEVMADKLRSPREAGLGQGEEEFHALGGATVLDLPPASNFRPDPRQGLGDIKVPENKGRPRAWMPVGFCSRGAASDDAPCSRHAFRARGGLAGFLSLGRRVLSGCSVSGRRRNGKMASHGLTVRSGRTLPFPRSPSPGSGPRVAVARRGDNGSPRTGSKPERGSRRIAAAGERM